MKRHAAATLLVTVLCSGCRKAASRDNDALVRDQHCYELESELRNATAEQTSLSMAVQEATRSAAETDARLSTDQQALDELQTATRNYMQQHDTAIAAMLAGAASMDTFGDASTSQDAKQVAMGVGLVALVWAATHQEELNDVVQSMQAARDRRVSLQQDMQQAQAAEAANQKQADDLKLRESSAQQHIALLRTALCTPTAGKASNW